MSTSEQQHELFDIVRSNAAAVLGHNSADAVGTDHEFIKALGLDSLDAVELWNRLKLATDLKLPTTAVFDHPTPKALAEYLASALDADEASTLSATYAQGQRIAGAPTCHANGADRIVLPM